MIKDRKKLVNKLGQFYQETLPSLRKKMVLEEIAVAGSQLSELADVHRHVDLHQLANQLRDQAESMAVDRLPITIKNVQEKIEELIDV